VTLELTLVSAPPLVGVSQRFEPGTHVVLGTPEDGIAALVALVSGITAPKSGRVRVADQDPRRAPAIRKRIGALLEAEERMPGRSVRDGVDRALRHHGGGDGAQALAALGIDRWATRPARELSARERRSVALAVALAVPSPALIALHEPLADVPGVERASVLDALGERAAAGAVVLCTTASVRDALELGGSLSVAVRGRLVRQLAISAASELAPRAGTELLVHAEPMRPLIAALAADAATLSVRWSDREAPHQLAVSGAGLEQTATAVLRAARASGVRIRALAPALPGVHEVRAASVAIARAAYDEAYRLAAERARAQGGTR